MTIKICEGCLNPATEIRDDSGDKIGLCESCAEEFDEVDEDEDDDEAPRG